MNQEEIRWDKLLKIKTSGRDDSRSDQYNYPYEATPYSVLERLAASGYISKKNTLIDYGSGKGRVDFYLAYQTRCRCIGVEYDERLYFKAKENQKTAASSGRVVFELNKAEDYQIPSQADRFYFFNPFSIIIFMNVFACIRDSYYRNPREMYLFFYYPSDEYVAELMTMDELMFVDDIDCKDLFDGENYREKILVFTFL